MQQNHGPGRRVESPGHAVLRLPNHASQQQRLATSGRNRRSTVQPAARAGRKIRCSRRIVVPAAGGISAVLPDRAFRRTPPARRSCASVAPPAAWMPAETSLRGSGTIPKVTGAHPQRRVFCQPARPARMRVASFCHAIRRRHDHRPDRLLDHIQRRTGVSCRRGVAPDGIEDECCQPHGHWRHAAQPRSEASSSARSAGAPGRSQHRRGCRAAPPSTAAARCVVERARSAVSGEPAATAYSRVPEPPDRISRLLVGMRRAIPSC